MQASYFAPYRCDVRGRERADGSFRRFRVILLGTGCSLRRLGSASVVSAILPCTHAQDEKALLSEPRARSTLSCRTSGWFGRGLGHRLEDTARHDVRPPFF